MRVSPDFTRNQKWEILAYILMFTFPNKGDTLDFLSLSGLSFLLSLVFFWFKLPWWCIHQRVSWAGLLCHIKQSPISFSLQVQGGKEQMNVSKQPQCYIPFCLFLKNPKKSCKNVVNVWLKVSLAGLHISDSFVYQRNTIALKKEKRFAVLYIKWCLFSILTLQVTSEGATSTGFCTYM